MFFTVLTFIAILAILVLAHEAGHFFAARRFGCKVEEFGFGFPPRIWGSKRDKKGTMYSVNLIPLGGFVKIKGEDGSERNNPESFSGKPAWQRALILSAGVIMNFLLAVVFLSIGFMVGVPTALDTDDTYARVADEKIQVMGVLENSAAKNAGIEFGDEIVGYVDKSEEELLAEFVSASPSLTASDIVEFSSIEEIQNYFHEHAGKMVLIAVQEPDKEYHTFLPITPQPLEGTDRAGIGVSLVETGIVSYPVYIAPVRGAQAAISLTGQIFSAFGLLLRDIVVNQKVSADVAGPVGIAVLTGQVVDQGAIYVLYFISLLSLNLAILNFIPFPALDGGRFLFLVIEKIRRKPVSHKVEGAFHLVGFALLLLLVLVITIRDVMNLL